MNIALIGGTGDTGEGLALQIADNTIHDVIIGSRSKRKSQFASEMYENTLAKHGTSANIDAFTNEVAASHGDIVILAVPPYYVSDTIQSISPGLDENTILVTPAVGMNKGKNGMHYRPPNIGSVTELVAQQAPDTVPVVGAYHSLPADKLTDLKSEFELDTLIVGNDPNAVQVIKDITNEIKGIRALEAGPLENAREVESLTPLAINIAKHNENMRHIGVKWR